MRNKGNISELYEQVKDNSLNRAVQNIVEKLGKNADMGDYIDDFKKSDAPQFKGASDEKRRQMAIAAYLDQKDKKEGFASDAQRRAAFAQGYKAKGKKDKDKKEEFVKEDGHTDVASAVRQCKTVTEDAMQILQKLQSMSPEESLPSWWTNKLAVASNSMNKLRDYFLVPSVSEEVELDEKAGDIPDLQKLIGELQNASKMHLAQSKRVQAHVDMMTRANAKGPEGAGGLQDLKKIVGELEKASQAHLRQSKSIDAHVDFMNKMEQDDPVKSAQDKADKLLKIAKVKQDAKDDIERIKATEEVKLDETIVDFDYSRNPKGIYNAFMQMSRKLGLTLFNAPTGMTDLKNKGTGRIGATKTNMVKFMKYLNSKGIEPKVEIVNEEVELDEMKEPFVVVDTADGNKVVGTASDEKGVKSIITSAELPPMKIKDKKTLKIMKSKKRQMIGQPFKEEYDHIKEMIQSGKFTRPEIKKMIERNILEQRSATGYTLFHRSFSDAMQHAYAFARTKMGMVVDPKEIDNKVATGPKKPGTGKTNSYSLKTNKGMLQIQVYNTGSGAKPFELNMYSS